MAAPVHGHLRFARQVRQRPQRRKGNVEFILIEAECPALIPGKVVVDRVLIFVPPVSITVAAVPHLYSVVMSVCQTFSALHEVAQSTCSAPVTTVPR